MEATDGAPACQYTAGPDKEGFWLLYEQKPDGSKTAVQRYVRQENAEKMAARLNRVKQGRTPCQHAQLCLDGAGRPTIHCAPGDYDGAACLDGCEGYEPIDCKSCHNDAWCPGPPDRSCPFGTEYAPEAKDVTL